ncbi:hypothetical protein ACET3X_006109 [Alternaria dauci]|uniref:SCP domain-containing protein n=1 Tax=Alternaria dauci TaxID=48095 RepID=A0ABR3UHC6_9PLEO
MRSAIAFSIAALAGSALAAPSYGGGYGGQPKNVKHVVEVVATVVKTVYVTEGYEVPKPTSVKPVYEAPAKPTMVYAPAKPSSSSVYVAPPPAPTSEAPKPTSTAPAYTPAPEPTSEAPAYTPAPEPTYEAAPPAPSSEAPKPTASEAAPAPAGGYMDIVSEWRAKLGMSDLENDSTLESNAMNVVVEGNGVMKHKLNPGTYGQVLAPGKPDMESFLSVFVGGWLCEIPTLPGLDGVCSTMSEGWAYEGQTGHAEILTSPNYSKIGCANHEGIWCCDLA